ncbi:kinase-like domain-containing protein [Leptodontidium sp. MPI-SDFR-AT-0119]|nr:kinase-like domain-containing protein [Leptodontidium sp. MPI-SDFR-AT-0119]
MKQFEPRSVPAREFGGPGQSFASYYSAQSSLRGSSSVATNFSSGFYSGPSRRNPMSFQQSPAYYSAKSSLVTNSDKTIMEAMHNPLSGYLKAVHEKGLVLPLDEELNWSGKENGGQHVEYAKGEVLPFEVIGPIGASLTAQVDKVRCRRILLARKTMVCGRRMTVEEALVEVEHLQNLRHPHIIQLVGSYLQGKKFSVLLYPVADCDLSVFLDEVHDLVQETPNLKTRGTTSHYLEKPIPPAIASMWSFFGCLADAIRYIHSSARKHLDIKPGNILVKKHPKASYGYRVYVADFGISRSFKSMDHSQTDTHIRRTPKYCAPEVWEQDVHGRAADIFSLGCVFMEMLTILCVRDLDDFTDFRSENSESSGAYHETIDRVFKWSEQLRMDLEGYFMYKNFFQTFESSGSLKPTIQGLDATLQMLAREPEKRKLPIFNRGEPGPDACHTCGDVPEKYEYDEEV